MAKSTAKKNIQKNTKAPADKNFMKNAGGQFGTDADNSLEDLFISGLKDTLWAENHLVKAIPKMIAAASDADLQAALTDHLEVTKGHAARLETALESLGEMVIAKKCAAMEGLTISGEHVIENTPAGTRVRDMGIIMSALKVENFEMTTYKGLIQLAGTLGKPDIADLLQQNMDEEEEASDVLTEMSQADPNA